MLADAASADARQRRETLQALAEWCRQFSPLVAVEESPRPDCLFLDITGLERIWGSQSALAEKIRAELAQRGWSAHLAIADTLGVAWAIARFGMQDAPSKIRIVAVSDAGPALAGLPLAALRLADETINLLGQLGVFQVGQLEALPQEDLLSRFGPELLRRWHQALGRVPEPLPAVPLPLDLQAQWTFEYPVAAYEPIQEAIAQLLETLGTRLRPQGLGALRLQCRIRDTAGREERIPVGLFQPTASWRHLAGLIQIHLEPMVWQQPVADIAIEVLATAPLKHHQQQLFACGGQPRLTRQLAALIDRLSSRLDWRQVARPRLLADAQPELACTYDALVDLALQSLPGRRGRAGAAGTNSPLAQRHGKSPQRQIGSQPVRLAARRAAARRPTAPRELPPRPLRLVRRPLALDMLSLAGHQLPVRFTLDGQLHQIAWSWGPERIETGWWRDRLVGRDYYRIETSTGQRYWIFRRLRDGRWFLHGLFE